MWLWVFVTVAVLLCVLVRLKTTSSSTAIPEVPGIPVLGNAIALGKGGLAFITQCRQQFGDVFCLRVLGQRMVFVFDPAMLSLFFKAPEASISFKPAVEQFTERIYGLPSSEFFARHEDLLATLRQLLVPSQLEVLGRSLLRLAQPQLQQWQEQQQVDLWPACQSLVFAAAGQVLFGPPFFKRHGLQAVQEAFLEFEGNFEVAASPVPHLLLPAFRRSRRALLSMLSASLAAGDFKHTVVEQLLLGCGLPERLWPNLLLAVLWASQANSMPAMFWSLSLLLLPEHAAARARVTTELHETAAHIRRQQQEQQQQAQCQPHHQQQQQQQAVDDVTAAAMLSLALDKRSWVSRCVAEAIRLRLHSIAVRFVSDRHLVLPTSTNTSSSSSCSSSSSSTSRGPARRSEDTAALHVPHGSILCICPIESHHDTQLYPDEPWAFKPDREAVQGLAAGTVVPGVAGMGFGGGFWRCPGRFFAEMELALLLQLVLLQLELTPLPLQQQQRRRQHRTDPAHKARPSTTSTAGSQSRSQAPHTHEHAHDTTAAAAALPCGLAALVPQWLQQRLQDTAVFGLGACGGNRRQEEQWRASGMAAAGAAAGGTVAASMASVLLPCCDLRRLVGFKVPAEPWWVAVGPVSGAAVI